jgi:hypothetical protein
MQLYLCVQATLLKCGPQLGHLHLVWSLGHLVFYNQDSRLKISAEQERLSGFWSTVYISGNNPVFETALE